MFLLLSQYITLLSYFFPMFCNQTKSKHTIVFPISLKFLLVITFSFSLFRMPQHLKLSSGSFNVLQFMKTAVHLAWECDKSFDLSWYIAWFHLFSSGECAYLWSAPWFELYHNFSYICFKSRSWFSAVVWIGVLRRTLLQAGGKVNWVWEKWW